MIKSQWESSAVHKRLKVIYPPFDASKLSAADKEPLEGEFKKNGNLVIGTIGRLSEEKRHVDLIKAFEKVSSVLPETKLLIVGDGYLRGYLEKIVEESDLREKVAFLGFQENVFKYLRKMDLFVLPSRTEGFGIALVEAMATGIPVIATSVGGIPEIVDNKINGLLVPPGQPSDLAEAIVKLLSHSALAKKMADNGRHKALTNFHPKRFIAQHEILYKDLASAKGLLQSN
jgi:glycosyltransferase involved in cell wall biosynthesis